MTLPNINKPLMEEEDSQQNNIGWEVDKEAMDKLFAESGAAPQPQTPLIPEEEDTAKKDKGFFSLPSSFEEFVKDNIDQTIDVGKGIVSAPLALGNDVLNLGADIVNAGLKFFDPDPTDGTPQLPRNELPEEIKPQTGVGKFISTGAKWYIGGKLIDGAMAARGIYGALSNPAQIRNITQTSSILQEFAKTVTQPSQFHGSVSAEFAKEAIKDFILNSPADDTLATTLKESGCIDHPFFDMMVIDDDDSYLVRRARHAMEGFVIGSTLEASFEIGRQSIKQFKGITDYLKGTPAEAVTQESINKYLDSTHVADYWNSIGYKLRKQLSETGHTDGEITYTMHFLESYAATAKDKGQSIAAYLEELPFAFNIKDDAIMEGALGSIDGLTPDVAKILQVKSLRQLKECPIDIALNICLNKADEGKKGAVTMHELSHFFLWDTYRRSHLENAKDLSKAQWDNIAKFIRWDDTQTVFTRDQCERFAHNFEDYLRKGSTSDTSLNKAFSQFKEWMMKMEIDGKYNANKEPEELTAIYARLFTTPDMDAETKLLCSKGINMPLIKKDVETSTRMILRRENLGEVDAAHPIINTDYVEGPEDFRILLDKVQETIAPLLRKHKADGYTFAETMFDSAPLMQALVSDTPNAAKNFRKSFEDAVKHGDYDYASRVLAGNDALVNILQQVIELVQTDVDNAPSAQKMAFCNKLADWCNLAQEVSNVRTGIARGQNIHKYIKTGDIIGATSDYLDTIVAKGVNGYDIPTIMKHLQMLPEPEQQVRYLKRLTTAPTHNVIDLLNEYYTNSLLSNPATHMVNVLGNTVVAGVSPAEHIIGGYINQGLAKGANTLGIDWLADWLKGGGDEAVQEGIYRYLNTFNAIQDGLQLAEASLKTGTNSFGTSAIANGLVDAVPEQVLSSAIFKMNPNTDAAKLIDTMGKMLNIPSRCCMAEDTFFKVIASRSEAATQLWKEALSKNITDPQAIKDYIGDNLASKFKSVYDETGKLIKQAAIDKNVEEYALVQTFNNDRGTLVSMLQTAKQKCPLLHPIIPFVRTPARILDWTIQRTPIGLLYESQRQAFLGGGAEASKRLGQYAVGGTFITGAVMLAQNGKLTGGGPDSFQAKKSMQDLGWQPYSIKIGDKWYSYNRLDPIGSFFGVVGDYMDLAQAASDSDVDNNSIADMAQMLMTVMAKNVTDKTYLQNIGTLIQIINNPDPNSKKVQSWAAQLAGGFVPRILANGARDTGITDPYMKEASDFAAKLKAKMPYLSNELPTQYSWMTGDARAYGDYSLVNFIPNREAAKDQVKMELLTYGAKLGGPAKTMSNTRLTDEQYSRLCELHGTVKLGGLTMMESLENLVESPVYQQLPEGQARMKKINAVIQQYRETARKQLRQEYPELVKTVTSPYNGGTSSDFAKLLEFGR